MGMQGNFIAVLALLAGQCSDMSASAFAVQSSAIERQQSAKSDRSQRTQLSASRLFSTTSPLVNGSVNGKSINGGAVNGNGVPTDENVMTTDILSLASIRSTLIRQEETIIFALIERAQFYRNGVVYKKGGYQNRNLGIPPGSTPTGDDDNLSFLEYMLVGTESLHCAVRRYTSPEEHAFFPERLPFGPLDALPNLEYPELLDGKASLPVNFNPILLQKYIDTIIPAIARKGDDEQHGSCVLADIAALQALSRRVHYGKFVAESKYRGDPEGYQRLVEAGDDEGVMELLTNAAVEEQVLRRARLKAATYGREPLLSYLPPIESQQAQPERDVTSVVAAAAAAAVVAAVDAMGNQPEEKSSHSKLSKIDPSVIEAVYRDLIIPLTKDVEVAYLFRRCGKEPPVKYGPDRLSTDL